MSDLPFSGKAAFITGSARGIGAAIAAKFSALGAGVVITHRKQGGGSENRAKGLVREIEHGGGTAIRVQCDISRKEQVREAVEKTKSHFGRLDILVLNAARAPFKPVEKLFQRELKDLVNTNYLGHIFCIQESVPLLEQVNGSIVFISSLGSRFYNPSYPLGSMKSAMETVVRDCSMSLKRKGISVNGVCGGIVKTDAFKTLRLYWEGVVELPEHLFVLPEELANVAAFLCRAESNGICGQTVVVDRGLGNTLYGLL